MRRSATRIAETTSHLLFFSKQSDHALLGCPPSQDDQEPANTVLI